MFRQRIFRLGTVGASAMLALMLLGVGGATASTPLWTSTASSVPGSVSPGNYAFYHVTVTNNGTSNISQLFLADNVSFAAFSASPSAGSCVLSPVLSCTLGALNAGKSDTIDVVYKTPASGTSFDIDFQFNTSGSTFSDQKHGKKPTSHGDNLDTPVSTVLDSSVDFAGGYVVFGGTSFSTATGDVQTTTVNAPGTGIPVTVTETSGGSSQCGSGTPAGQLVTLNVNGGAKFSSDFLTTITIEASSLPDELELADVSLCHQYDDGTSALLPVCPTDAAPAGQSACFYPKWSGTRAEPKHPKESADNDADDHLFLVLDVFDFQNGGVRGQYG
ncbi:MAG TPA: hypothetical protein VFW20_02935 [Candidatus Limnocylindrales bacterium]|nr:hypothetical protein [Candidatus Limnocylindrales bacterium]